MEDAYQNSGFLIPSITLLTVFPTGGCESQKENKIFFFDGISPLKKRVHSASVHELGPERFPIQLPEMFYKKYVRSIDILIDLFHTIYRITN